MGMRKGIGLWTEKKSFDFEQMVEKAVPVLDLVVDVRCQAHKV